MCHIAQFLDRAAFCCLLKKKNTRCFRPFSPYEWLPHRLPFSRLIPQLSRFLKQLSLKRLSRKQFFHKHCSRKLWPFSSHDFLHTLRHPYSHLFGHPLFEPHTSHWVKIFLLVAVMGVASLLFSSSTQADASWTMEKNDQSSQLKLSVSSNKVRVDISNQPNQFGLFDGRTNTLYWVDAQSKEYQSWKQPLAFSGNQDMFSSQPTGRKTIEGIDCRQMEIQKGNVPVDQVCVASPKALGLSKQEAGTFKRFIRSLSQLELAMTTSSTLDNIASLGFTPQLNLPSSPKPRWSINEPSQPNRVLRPSSNWGQDGGRRTLASDLPPEDLPSSRNNTASELSPPRMPFAKAQSAGSDNRVSFFPSDLGNAWLVAGGIPLSLRNLSSGEQWRIKLNDEKTIKEDDFAIPSDFQARSWGQQAPITEPSNEAPLREEDDSQDSAIEDSLRDNSLSDEASSTLEPTWPRAPSSSGFRIPDKEAPESTPDTEGEPLSAPEAPVR